MFCAELELKNERRCADLYAGSCPIFQAGIRINQQSIGRIAWSTSETLLPKARRTRGPVHWMTASPIAVETLIVTIGLLMLRTRSVNISQFTSFEEKVDLSVVSGSKYCTGKCKCCFLPEKDWCKKKKKMRLGKKIHICSEFPENF